MFRFTIRDVLWLTVVVAMGVGLWMEHRSLVYERETNKEGARLCRQRTELLQHYLETIGVTAKWREGETGMTFATKQPPAKESR